MDQDLTISTAISDPAGNPTRRTLLSLLGAGAIAGGVATIMAPESAEARKKKGKKKKKHKKKGGKGRGKIKCSGKVVGSAAASEETALLQQINAFRQQNGNPGDLARDPQLDSAAAAHSRDMATRCYFEHISPEGSDPFDRMNAAGYTGTPWAENLYVGSGNLKSAAQAFEAWRTSKAGHREAMLDPDANEIGIGTALDGAGNLYWTNVFGKRP
jgi:uncharacterized protein YkwD